MSKLYAKERYESIHDFVRSAVAEAKLIISDIEKYQIEIETAPSGAANVPFTPKSGHSKTKAITRVSANEIA